MSKQRKFWTDNEINSLKDDYGILSPKELENKYDIDYGYIRKACSKYGIKSKKNRNARKWIEAELNDFIKDWKDNILSISELKEKYNRQENSLRCKAKDLKIKRITNIDKLSNEDIYSICNKYTNGINSQELTESYNVCQSSILSILKNNNIEIRDNSHCKRTYAINENYFDNIDSEHKAYWLGFLYADGYNQEERNCVCLGLQKQDKYILKEFLNDLSSNYPIHTVYNKKFNENYYNIRLSNKRISEQLSKHGIVQNKTFISKFPQINDNLISHFIRGLFDGDGCISLSLGGVNNDRMYATFSIINGNELFLNNVKKYLNINNSSLVKKYKSIFSLSYSKYVEIENIYNLLYKDATIFLIRKREKFEKYLKYKKESGHFEKNFRTN